MNTSDLKSLLALSFIDDIGHVTAGRLLSAFHSPHDIFDGELPDIAAAAQISISKAKKIKQFASWDNIDREIELAERLGVKIIALPDDEYPAGLGTIDGAPPVLYVKGDMMDEDRFALAVVGSRLMSAYGRKTASDLTYDLAMSGLTIVSGMARGIDTASHAAALKAGGRSIAVLGCGIDICYPSENRKLMNEISASGCVISEFPLGTQPLRENFPRRNRLISGLSLGVLVIEAATSSGSLITAEFALEQGREVFAVPGNITSDKSAGTNGLIRKGAKPVTCAEDVLEELAPQIKDMIKRTCAPGAGVRQAGLEINEEEKAICNILGSESRHIDNIARELNMTAGRLSGVLLGLELKGIIRQTEGNNFSIV